MKRAREEKVPLDMVDSLVAKCGLSRDFLEEFVMCRGDHQDVIPVGELGSDVCKSRYCEPCGKKYEMECIDCTEKLKPMPSILDCYSRNLLDGKNIYCGLCEEKYNADEDEDWRKLLSHRKDCEASELAKLKCKIKKLRKK